MRRGLHKEEMDAKDKRIQELEKIVKAQAVLIQKLKARIAELERSLGLMSNSHDNRLILLVLHT